MYRSIGYVLLLASVTSCASTAVQAENPMGFYVGAGGGESRIRTDTPLFPFGNPDGTDDKFDGHSSAWKVMAGIRPLSFVGAELEYIDFGNPGTGVSQTSFGALTKAGAKAGALFGIGYLPLPIPFLDVYGKLGLARLQTSLTEISPVPFCPAGASNCARSSYRQSEWGTDLAYGAGVQGRTGHLAVRAEYERISASKADPDIFSLGVTWSF
jgi:opacity protein-like surface antigen